MLEILCKLELPKGNRGEIVAAINAINTKSSRANIRIDEKEEKIVINIKGDPTSMRAILNSYLRIMATIQNLEG